ncbi:lipopolysaccharide assembly protein LapA domain-containing protein [Geodermatophilus sp. SYSU D01036]
MAKTSPASTRPAAPSSRPARRRIRPGQVLALVLAVVTVAFIVQNRDRVTVDLFTVDVSSPLWLILTIVLLIGVLLGMILRSRR